jgi:hypothetical protein
MSRPSQIYALTDTDGSIRYIGKANDAAARLKGHLSDAKRGSRPVNRWVKKLVDAGKAPGLLILEEREDWPEAERRLIAQYRAAGARPLNLAEGGEQPFCPAHVRAENGRKNAKARNRRLWLLKLQLGQGLKRGEVGEMTQRKMFSRPDVFGGLFHLMNPAFRPGGPFDANG